MLHYKDLNTLRGIVAEKKADRTKSENALSSVSPDLKAAKLHISVEVIT